MTYEAFHPLPTLFASMFHSAYQQPPIELESALKNLTLYFHSQVFLVASLLKKGADYNVYYMILSILVQEHMRRLT